MVAGKQNVAPPFGANPLCAKIAGLKRKNCGRLAGRRQRGTLALNQTNEPNLGCLPEGLPRFMIAVPYPMEIFQVPTRVLIIHEGVSVMRQIHMNRQHPKDLDPTYSGDSIGKLEGGTLVVDTIGFNDKTWLDGGGLPHSEALHVVERIRRVDHDTLAEDFTIDDPMAYTKPITAQQVYKLKPGWEIQEFVCEENNKYHYQEK